MLGKEVIEANEEENIRKIVALLKRKLEKVYAKGKTLRHFHAKMHGYVDAEFIVDSNLAEHLKIGIFKQPKTYPCKIRFSNGSSRLKPDKRKDVRGLAIQLKDENNITIQDFVLNTANILSPGKIKAYKTAMIASTGNLLQKVLYASNPANWKDIRLFLKSLERCPNLLEVNYFSASPYLFNEGNAVKYNVHPTSSTNSSIPKNKTNDFLRESLVKDLANATVYLDFRVQFQEDSIMQPIEDSRVEWKTSFQKVATILIPAQTFDTPAIRMEGEKMKFSPWTCLPQHRPLGGLNRARKDSL